MILPRSLAQSWRRHIWVDEQFCSLEVCVEAACLVQTPALAITLGPIRISALSGLDRGQHHSGCWEIPTCRCQTLNMCTGAYDHHDVWL